jgi:hypothetical protein
MAGKFLSAAFVFAAGFLVNASAALAAAASDPTKIGDNAQKLIDPNLKSFWWIGLAVGTLVLALTRKASWAGKFYGGMLIAAIVLYNPGGVSTAIQDVSNKLLVMTAIHEVVNTLL